MTSKRGSYPHTDTGVEVRRIFHELRSRAIENFNGQFKSIFDVHAQVPTKGCSTPLDSRSGHPSLPTGIALPTRPREGFACRAQSLSQGSVIYDQASASSVG